MSTRRKLLQWLSALPFVGLAVPAAARPDRSGIGRLAGYDPVAVEELSRREMDVANAVILIDRYLQKRQQTCSDITLSVHATKWMSGLIVSGRRKVATIASGARASGYYTHVLGGDAFRDTIDGKQYVELGFVLTYEKISGRVSRYMQIVEETTERLITVLESSEYVATDVQHFSSFPGSRNA